MSNELHDAVGELLDAADYAFSRAGGAFPINEYENLRRIYMHGKSTPASLEGLAESALRSAIAEGRSVDALNFHALLLSIRSNKGAS